MMGSVHWVTGTALQGVTSRGQVLDYDWKLGPSPMEVTLQMVGACSLVDVVGGLKDREFTKAWVELQATRQEESPRKFTSITMVYHVVGNVPKVLVERVVAKSHEKYCSVSASLDPSIDISWTVELHDASQG